MGQGNRLTTRIGWAHLLDWLTPESNVFNRLPTGGKSLTSERSTGRRITQQEKRIKASQVGGRMQG